MLCENCFNNHNKESFIKNKLDEEILKRDCCVVCLKEKETTIKKENNRLYKYLGAIIIVLLLIFNPLIAFIVFMIYCCTKDNK